MYVKAVVKPKHLVSTTLLMQLIRLFGTKTHKSKGTNVPSRFFLFFFDTQILTETKKCNDFFFFFLCVVVLLVVRTWVHSLFQAE